MVQDYRRILNQILDSIKLGSDGVHTQRWVVITKEGGIISQKSDYFLYPVEIKKVFKEGFKIDAKDPEVDIIVNGEIWENPDGNPDGIEAVVAYHLKPRPNWRKQ